MPEKLGDRIRRKRKEKDLGLREAATKLGISAAYLSRIETCEEKIPPGEQVIGKMAKLFDDNSDELMQLAERVPSDVAKYVTNEPGLPAFLRTARDQKLTAEDLKQLLKQKGKGKR